MITLRRCLVIAVLVGPVALGRGGEAKDDERPGEAEVSFANGSQVRLSLHQDKIDVLTRYGKLAIPADEIQRIDFGVHLSPETAKQVDEAVRKLASLQYSEREEGTRDLIALGPPAYAAALSAVRHSDPEVAKRAEKILAALRAKHPEKDLRSREDDLIATPGFTIVGRIITPAFRAKSEYFGDVQLQLSQLRQLRSIRNPGELQITIDAAQHGSAHGQWLDTGFLVDTSASLAVTASGSVDIYPQTPGQYMSTPRGYANNALAGGAKVVVNQANYRNFSGALFGRVGDGDIFYIGDRYEGVPGREGRLYLHIVPSPWNNASSGSYQVKISSRN